MPNNVSGTELGTGDSMENIAFFNHTFIESKTIMMS